MSVKWSEYAERQFSVNQEPNSDASAVEIPSKLPKIEAKLGLNNNKWNHFRDI